MKIYVASSWRNDDQHGVVVALRAAGHEVYDFKNPQAIEAGHLSEEGVPSAFAWSDIDPNWKDWTNEQYLKALQDPIAVRAFNCDHGAMEWSDACVLVLPCGRSAHTELGYYDGARKPFFILLPTKPMEPELMYKSATEIVMDTGRLLEAVAAADPTNKKWRTRVRVNLDIEVDVTLNSQTSFGHASDLAQSMAEHAFRGLRVGSVCVQQVNTADVYLVERQKE